MVLRTTEYGTNTVPPFLHEQNENIPVDPTIINEDPHVINADPPTITKEEFDSVKEELIGLKTQMDELKAATEKNYEAISQTRETDGVVDEKISNLQAQLVDEINTKLSEQMDVISQEKQKLEHLNDDAHIKLNSSMTHFESRLLALEESRTYFNSFMVNNAAEMDTLKAGLQEQSKEGMRLRNLFLQIQNQLESVIDNNKDQSSKTLNFFERHFLKN